MPALATSVGPAHLPGCVEARQRREDRRTQAPTRGNVGSTAADDRRGHDQPLRAPGPVRLSPLGERSPSGPNGLAAAEAAEVEDCFIIYDYTSFPQLPRSDQEDADFKKILGSMDDFVRRVIVLEGPDYLTRGWCVYEYIVASLRSSTVCDEVQDGRFVGLRDWASTVPPVTLSFRDSFESQQQNFINERILAAVDDLLQIYREARFKNDYDRDGVASGKRPSGVMTNWRRSSPAKGNVPGSRRASESGLLIQRFHRRCRLRSTVDMRSSAPTCWLYSTLGTVCTACLPPQVRPTRSEASPRRRAITCSLLRICRLHRLR